LEDFATRATAAQALSRPIPHVGNPAEWSAPLRQIGTLPRDLDPRVLTDHLTALGMATRVDERPEGSVVWVYHEDHLDRARQELADYIANPDDPRYASSKQVAEDVRRKARELDRKYQKNFRDMGSAWDRPNLHRRPLTAVLIAISAVVFLLQNWAPPSWHVMTWLTFTTNFLNENNGPNFHALDDILHGEVWRLITPIFLHFGIIHLMFNMWALWILGSLIEERRGTKAMAILVFVSAIASNTGEFAYDLSMNRLAPFGGMSGVVYALFGYVWMKGRFEPEQGMILHPSTVRVMLFWLVLCFTNLAGPIANAAHVVGLIVGVLYGLARF
jgi:GlpG protein